jgi:IS1 family transposase
VDAGQAAA